MSNNEWIHSSGDTDYKSTSGIKKPDRISKSARLLSEFNKKF